MAILVGTAPLNECPNLTHTSTSADIQGSENPDLGAEVLESADHHKFLHQFDDKLDEADVECDSSAEIESSDTPAVTTADASVEETQTDQDQDVHQMENSPEKGCCDVPLSPARAQVEEYASSEGSPQLAFTEDSGAPSPAPQIADAESDDETEASISLDVSPVAVRTRSSRRQSSMLPQQPACDEVSSRLAVPAALPESQAEQQGELDEHQDVQGLQRSASVTKTEIGGADSAISQTPGLARSCSPGANSPEARSPTQASTVASPALPSPTCSPMQQMEVTPPAPQAVAAPATQVSSIKQAPTETAAKQVSPIKQTPSQTLAQPLSKPKHATTVKSRAARRVKPAVAKQQPATAAAPSATARARSQLGRSTKPAAGAAPSTAAVVVPRARSKPAVRAVAKTATRGGASRPRAAPRAPTAAEVQAKAEAAARISSTTKELQEIQAARKELARRRAANARRMAAMKTAPAAGAPARGAAKPRSKQSAPAVAAVAVPPPAVPEAHRKPTEAQPFSFAYDVRAAARKGSEDAGDATSPYVGMAEGMAKWLAQDKPRFHSKSARELAKGPSPIKDVAHRGPTSPHPFHFATDDVVPQHGGKVLSTAQEEEAYLAALKPFKATPYDPAAACVTSHAAHVERRPLTTPMSPALQTDRRLGKKAPAVELEPSPMKTTFKARPVPASVLSGSVAMSGATLHRAVATIPVSPPLRTRARADTRPPAAPLAEPHVSPFKASEMPDYAELSAPAAPVEHKPPTVAQPFHLRTDERHAQSVAALEAAQAQQMAAEEAARHFKARAVGEGVDSRGAFVAAPSIPRQPTRAQPFALSQPNRAAHAASHDTATQSKPFKARPVPASVRAPMAAKPKRTPRSATAVSAAKPLASDARAEKRAAYEAAKAKRDAQRAARQAQADAAKAAADAEALRALRKASEFKARPVGAGVPAPRVGGHTATRRAPTIPVSPKLGPTAKRSARSTRGGPGRLPLKSADNVLSA